jgi:hypothetical protein
MPFPAGVFHFKFGISIAGVFTVGPAGCRHQQLPGFVRQSREAVLGRRKPTGMEAVSGKAKIARGRNNCSPLRAVVQKKAAQARRIENAW